MGTEKRCRICGKPFMANKYRPNQEVCSSIECQYQRQLDNMGKWRQKNKNYFKYKEASDESWKEACRLRSLEWRKRHQEYLRLYRESHRNRHKDYMREYMRQYRKRRKVEDLPKQTKEEK